MDVIEIPEPVGHAFCFLSLSLGLLLWVGSQGGRVAPFREGGVQCRERCSAADSGALKPCSFIVG